VTVAIPVGDRIAAQICFTPFPQDVSGPGAGRLLGNGALGVLPGDITEPVVFTGW